VFKATIGKKLNNLKRKLAQNTVFTLIPPIYKSEFSGLEVKKFSKKRKF